MDSSSYITLNSAQGSSTVSNCPVYSEQRLHHAIIRAIFYWHLFERWQSNTSYANMDV